MIIGIGLDMIEISRIAKACERKHFLERCYTKKEVELFSATPASLAGNFAVKEAVAKSLGTGFRGFELQDIEVLRNDAGAPFVHLYAGAEEKRKELGIVNFHISITNLKEYASAVAVAEGKDNLCRN